MTCTGGMGRPLASWYEGSLASGVSTMMRGHEELATWLVAHELDMQRRIGKASSWTSSLQCCTTGDDDIEGGPSRQRIWA